MLVLIWFVDLEIILIFYSQILSLSSGNPTPNKSVSRACASYIAGRTSRVFQF